MKLAWICYRYEEDVASNKACLEFHEPSSWAYFKVIPIVYQEIQQ